MQSLDEIQQIVRQSLLGWKLAGVSSLPGEINRTAIEVPSARRGEEAPRENRESQRPIHSQQEVTDDMHAPRKAAASKPRKTQDEPVSSSSEPVNLEPVNLAPSNLGRSDRLRVLNDLSCQVAKCTRCSELAETRTQTVFGVGNPEARLLFMGEAPGADEDKQGEPFVGRAGQLLNKIIEAMGFKREDLYICNILRCRPPGNRAPTPVEAANCREWLNGQLQTVDPDFIVCWGTVASQNLLNSTDAISKMRGRFFPYGRAKVLCTYHPSYLLRNPSAKKPVWEDMQLLLREMGLPVPK